MNFEVHCLIHVRIRAIMHFEVQLYTTTGSIMHFEVQLYTLGAIMLLRYDYAP